MTASAHYLRGCLWACVALVAACRSTPVEQFPTFHSALGAPAKAERQGVISGQLVSRETGLPVVDSSQTVVFALRRSGTRVTSTTVASGSPQTRVMRWQGEMFTPSFLVIGAGTLVRFENRTQICHRVFSSSETSQLELSLLKPGKVQEHRFNRPGLIHLYCSLHQGKQATILVAPTSDFAIVDSRGCFTIRDLGPGRYVLEAWREGCRLQHREIVVSRDGAELIEVAIPAAPVKGS